MIYRWLISFSLLLSPATLRLGVAATVSGSVTLVDSQEAAVRKNKNYAGVIVWLQPIGNATQTLHNPPHAQILQQNKKFQPHILAVPVGTTVDFPNADPIFHNAFSNFDGKIFDIGLYAPGTSRGVRFDRPGIVRVFCNIHPTMSAVIAVLPTTLFATSAADGSFAITNVPPGEFKVGFLHERAAPSVLDALSRRIEVRDANVTLPPITISENGYLARPHRNKYGKEYPPAPVDSLYPGARK